MIRSISREPATAPETAGGFEQFWGFYLSVHQEVWTRRVHATATVLGASCVLVAFPLTLDVQWLLAGPALGYPLAWLSHLFCEGRPPAMFSHPAWALRCDLRMVRLMFAGRLDAEWERIRALQSATVAPRQQAATA